MNGHREGSLARTPFVFDSGRARIPQAKSTHSLSGIYRPAFTIFTWLAAFTPDF